MSKFYKKIIMYNKCDLNPDFEMIQDDRFDYSFIVSCKTSFGIESFTNSLETIVESLKDTISHIELTNLKSQNNINTDEKSGIMNYSYSIGQKVMKCSIL
jgi:tRNA U34 5-carboxymethylaminomethyl modifying GTPase MnmE/TrmE